ncbi:MAG: hypothetical protein GTN78_26235 [Gemmatimonadales bacterium]|nr:hypothetical protein [Gemmatimonadales bacterium]
MIVNGLENPRVQCPSGDPELFVVGPEFGGVYTCDGDGCIVEPLWDLHLGATEMWCRNGAGDSPVVPIAVPEPNGFLFGFFAVWLCYAVWRFMRGYDKDRKRMNWLEKSHKARVYIRSAGGYCRESTAFNLRMLIDEAMEEE